MLKLFDDGLRADVWLLKKDNWVETKFGPYDVLQFPPLCFVSAMNDEDILSVSEGLRAPSIEECGISGQTSKGAARTRAAMMFSTLLYDGEPVQYDATIEFLIICSE